MEEQMIQYVKVKLADGRSGIFVGPVLISKDEVKNNKLKIASVNFSEPHSKPQPVVDAKVVKEPVNEEKK